MRILIADDHPIVRHGLKQMLASDPSATVVGEATNGRDADLRTRLIPEQPVGVAVPVRHELIQIAVAIRREAPPAGQLV